MLHKSCHLSDHLHISTIHLGVHFRVERKYVCIEVRICAQNTFGYPVSLGEAVLRVVVSSAVSTEREVLGSEKFLESESGICKKKD